jgi:hypothetical protein
MAKTRVVEENRVPTVKVRALKDNVREHLVHKPTNFKFNKDGISHWPFDQFTKRRINDGDVELVKDEPAEQQQQPAEQQARPAEQQTEARRRRVADQTRPTE